MSRNPHPLVIKARDEVDKQTQERAVQALAPWPWVELHLNDWAAAHREDPVLQVTLDWIADQKKGDPKKLFSEHTESEEGSVVLCTQQKLTLHQGALYQWHTTTGEIEEILWFVVHKVHWIAALNGCHRDTGHQGWQQMQFLLQDCFWWPGMGDQMWRMLKNCERCIQHEGAQSKVPLHQIVVTAHLELLHVDYMSIETTMVLNKPPKVINVLVFQDHFTKQVMGYVTWSDHKDLSQVSVPRVHLNLLSPGHTHQWSGSELLEQCHLEVVQAHGD